MKLETTFGPSNVLIQNTGPVTASIGDHVFDAENAVYRIRAFRAARQSSISSKRLVNIVICRYFQLAQGLLVQMVLGYLAVLIVIC